MNYERHYTNLIMKAKKRHQHNPEWADGIYTEMHHWFPKSLFPQWASADWNKVMLTAKEHFIAHWLLKRWLEVPEMQQAFFLMCSASKNGGRTGNKYVASSTAYEEGRKAYVVVVRERTRGENNPCFGKFGKEHPAFGYKHSESFKEDMKKMNTGKVLSSITRDKISKANRGKHAGILNPMFGKTHTDEVKQKIRENMPSTKGWLNARAKTELWLRLDEAYEFVCRTGKSGRMLGYEWGYGNKTPKTLYSLVNWIKENGDPMENDKWLEWKRCQTSQMRL